MYLPLHTINKRCLTHEERIFNNVSNFSLIPAQGENIYIQLLFITRVLCQCDTLAPTSLGGSGFTLRDQGIYVKLKTTLQNPKGLGQIVVLFYFEI